METYTKLAIFAMVLVVAIWSQPSMANDEDPICGISRDDLMLCKPAVVGLTGQTPSSACCKSLSKANLPCLCKFESSPWISFLGINPDLAKKLPVNCKIDPSFKC